MNAEPILNRPTASLLRAIRWLLIPDGARRLALTGLAGMLLVILLDRVTQPRINRQHQAERQRVMRELFAETGTLPFDFEDSVTISPALPQRGPLTLHRVWQNGEVKGLFLQVTTPEGYNGDITYAVALDRNGVLRGVRVLRHRETPGLGDRIETARSDWILGFSGTSLTHPPRDRWAVRRDGGAFDQFTGATITPRALVKSLRDTLQLIESHPELLDPAPSPPSRHP